MLVRWCLALVPVLGIISEVKGSIGGRSALSLYVMEDFIRGKEVKA